MQGLRISLALALLAALNCGAAEEFKWSWDGDLETSPTTEEAAAPDKTAPEAPQAPVSEPPAAAPVAAPAGDSEGTPLEPAAAAPVNPDDDIGGLVPVPDNPDATPETTVVAEAPSPVTAETAAPPEGQAHLAEAYRQLLDDNLKLRRKITDAENQGEAIRKENERLTGELRDLEKRIEESVRVIRELKQAQQKAGADPEQVALLEEKLQAAEAEKRTLGEELTRVRSQAAATAEPPAAAEGPAPADSADPAVAVGSDLFKQVEQENRALKEKLAAAEAERQKAMTGREEVTRSGEAAQRSLEAAEARQKELEKALAQEKASGEEQKQTLGRLMKQIPDLERELVDLRTQLAEKRQSGDSVERQTAALKAELERREQRLKKAERMAALMEQTRSEVHSVDRREKRDMHYNMAVVYQREGKFREAEAEYLNAIQVDPSDPDVHYNLGILYDDELNDKQKAAVHYRRYLKLAPAAPDADQVKEWLIRLGVGQ